MNYDDYIKKIERLMNLLDDNCIYYCEGYPDQLIRPAVVKFIIKEYKRTLNPRILAKSNEELVLIMKFLNEAWLCAIKKKPWAKVKRRR